MDRNSWAALAGTALLLIAGLGACKPQIGDDCETSQNCSATGDRLCDTTQPGGYCTMFNCEPGTCPDEAICVGFGNVLSPVKACTNPQAEHRFQRTFCMRRCDSRSDCRSGYVCADMGKADNEWGAIVVESGRRNGKVCAVPFKNGVVTEPDEDAGGVCIGSYTGDAAPPPRPDAGVSDSGGDAASDAADGGDAASDAEADGGAIGDASSDQDSG